MKIVVSVNVLPNYISLLIVGSLKSVIFMALPLFFSRSWSTQNAEHIKRFLRLHIVIKPLIRNRLNKFFITLKRNSFKISPQIIGACQKLEQAGRIGDFGNFLNGFTN